jgi:hypothetical protein
MQDYGSKPSMLGPVHIYIIWFGSWANTGIDQWIQLLVPALIEGMNDSAYSAILENYYDNDGGPSGLLTIAKQVQLSGQTLVDDPQGNSGVVLESAYTPQVMLSSLFADGTLANDINGVYLILPHSDIPPQITQDGLNFFLYPSWPGGTTWCGYNWNGVISGTHNIKYAVVPEEDPTSTTICQWNTLTPNFAGGLDLNGQIDGMLNSIAHELSEAITDPSNPQGWLGAHVGGQEPQEADFCAWQKGTTYPTALTGAPANARLGNTDFLIQPQRANGNNGNGSVGYCVNNYGGSFWGKQFGLSWSPIGDWSPGHYKGECQSGQPLIGISEFVPPLAGGPAHAVFCGTDAISPGAAAPFFDLFQQSSACYLRPFDGLNGVDGSNRGDTDNNTNWDPGGGNIGECAANEFVAGVGQDHSGRTNGLLCCPGSVGHNACVPEFFYSPLPGIDWDYGFAKAQCQSADQYIAGISVSPQEFNNWGSPEAILCCSP